MTSIMNEMASGCCVCSDERGWAENPLVYCDGVGCNIGVHKACYGIVTVPSGNWYCRKCESQERSARVRCELCPSKDGALKRTDNNGWAHVICGLYIPEVRFGSVTTMEPILLSQIPAERFNKVCYICEQNNRGRASVGACMECNKAGCKQQFHVTCAQAMGLLCEEPGNYMDNVKYCGYCQEHYMKIRKNSNVKTIPPYKPVSIANSGSDESPEKKLANFNQVAADLKQTTKRKTASSRPAAANGSSRLSSERKEPYVQQSVEPVNGAHNTNTPSPSVQPQVVKERTLSASNGPTVSSNSTLPQTMGLNDANSRFTTSNFVESVITPSESVFADVQKNKKRKMNEALAPPILDGHCSQQLLPEQQSQITATTPEPSLQEFERTVNKATAIEDHDEDNDDDSGDLKFVEEPNLSTLKSASSAPTSESVNITSSVISTVTSGADSLSASLSVSNSHAINTSINVSTTIKAPATNVKSQPTLQTANPVTSSYLSSSSVTAAETKISKFQNNSNAPHMLGNQLNPTSTMAQKMMDSLNDELKAHSIFTNSDSDMNTNNFVGPPLYNKIISSSRTKESTKRSNSPSNGGPLASLSGSAANFPQTLEELLEKQWEQGGTFLMEQAQHFDIASLLTCLHKLREENLELEEHIRKLKARRDHLLGVNARLAMPLAPITQPVNNSHSSSQTPPQHTSAPTSQSIPHLSLHHHMPHQSQQSAAHQSSLPPPTHQTAPHSQTHYNQSATNASLCGSSAAGNGGNLSENSQLRNIPLPPNMSNIYMPPSPANLRTPQTSVYQNQHSIENGLMPHHQHARVMTAMSTSGPMRHHNSTSNPSMYASNQHSQPPQSSNPGVVVRTSNMPEVGRGDRRTSAVMSSY